MSQQQQPPKGKRQAAKGGKAHADKNASGASGDKKGAETTEKKIPTSIAESPKTQASGTSSSSKVSSSSTVASKTTAMKASETKASPSQPKTSGSESHKRKRNKKQATQKSKTEPEKAVQLVKSDDSLTKHPSEEKQKDPGGAKSPSKPSVITQPKLQSTGKPTQTDGTSVKLTSREEAKVKTDKKPLAGKAAVASTGVGVTAPVVTAASLEIKENKLAATTPAASDSKPAEKSDLDTALDDLIDTLGGPEENEPPAPAYTGPQVSEGPLSSLYIEELGKRESTIPPEYRKLLESKGDDRVVPSPATAEESQPTMTDDDLADALSSDFTCSAVSPPEEKNVMPKKKPAEEGDLLLPESASLVSSPASPKEKKPKLEEIGDTAALDALVDTLGMPEPEPEIDLSSIVEVEEPKAKERKEKKAGEDDDTIPPEYRFKPTLDKDGKPLLPEPEEKPKPISELDLVDEFSKDFASPVPPAEVLKPSKPSDTSVKPAAAEPPKAPKGEPVASPTVPAVQPSAPSGVSTKPSTAASKKCSTEEVVSVAMVPSVQSSAPTATSPSAQVSDEALEALSGSLGKREPDPKEKKPAVDKVKEKTKREEREKLGEDEETIPPEYRFVEAKDKDGKPLLPKPEEKPKPLSESELLDALSEGFSSSPAPTSKAAAPEKSKGASKPAAASTDEMVSSTVASAVQSSAPPAVTTPNRKELDDAADLLADSLGQRQPDPDENKPVVDKIKEKARSEHIDKLGERDDTIPPEYRHLLDSDEKGKSIKPTSKDDETAKDKKKPSDDSAAIDALSGDFDNCGKPPVSQQSATKDEKTKDTTTSKPARKDEKKPKSSKKAKEQSSSAKSEKQKKELNVTSSAKSLHFADG
ncbi:calpastatin isoform X2 [Sceloporus undulatus]|uniref:calpastatin isoform X2 n=1 Tax=Sceloporus undulatus TaxID=8520 RepID=UPI001C4D129F|nr:calpastatin isoform X2 [Sceloporus undulatus]